MARTASMMIDLGTIAPPFSLPDVRTGKKVSPVRSGKPLLVMFICKHCPFVVHVKEELAQIGKDYANKIDVIAICSNDATSHPEDSAVNLKKMAEDLDFVFPLCQDESQDVAKAYTAACTPDFFLFDAEHKLAYRGQLDGSRPSNQITVDGRDLRAAMDALLTGFAPSAIQYPSVGCNIKWKSGQQPEYFESALVKN
jgi:thiol-disulfide isomerase/thioredoxin